ncbi:unnamed protein product [Haemonchus placei]|uniref:Uncharacterized protein n=1 Tax=Haemonchus placei TaxID=6290 RepID=A0A0N4W9M5_HAEPC|nr:unnamed protein product [Haemonchus placei]
MTDKKEIKMKQVYSGPSSSLPAKSSCAENGESFQAGAFGVRILESNVIG